MAKKNARKVPRKNVGKTPEKKREIEPGQYYLASPDCPWDGIDLYRLNAVHSDELVFVDAFEKKDDGGIERIENLLMPARNLDLHKQVTARTLVSFRVLPAAKAA